MKTYKILKQKSDCVLLKKLNTASGTLYKVRDIENDDVYMGYDYVKALAFFEQYDITDVRKTREETFKEWLEEFTE